PTGSAANVCTSLMIFCCRVCSPTLSTFTQPMPYGEPRTRGRSRKKTPGLVSEPGLSGSSGGEVGVVSADAQDRLQGVGTGDEDAGCRRSQGLHEPSDSTSTHRPPAVSTSGKASRT